MNSFIERIMIRFRNHIDIDNIHATLFNVHCAGNNVFIKGQNSTITVDDEGYIRNSTCYINGTKNHVSIGKKSVLTGNCTIRIIGDNNTVTIDEDCSITDSSIYIKGDNNSIVIGKKVSAVFTSFLIERNHNSLNIGNSTSIHGRANGTTEFALDEATSIIVKEDCMISNDVSIRSSDSHSILNEKGERLNPAGNIIIGDHVWIGMRSIILKNVMIRDNCIIGAGSICNKDYEKENCLIAGNPAKIVKERITWSRDRL